MRDQALPETCPQGCGCTDYVDDPTGGPYGRSASRAFVCGSIAGSHATWNGSAGASRHQKIEAQQRVDAREALQLLLDRLDESDVKFTPALRGAVRKGRNALTFKLPK